MGTGVAARPHGPREAGQFLHRFALHANGGQKCGRQYREWIRPRAERASPFRPPVRSSERPSTTAWSRSRVMIQLGAWATQPPLRTLSIVHMKIHEYQAKSILAKYNVPVPRGEVAFTVAEAEAAAKKIGGSVVVKAQIHAGGRGKGGGVKIAKSVDEADCDRRENARHDARDPPDRARRTSGAAAADRRNAAHRARALSRPGSGPRGRKAGFHGVGGGRHGNRRGCGQNSGSHSEGNGRSRPWAAAL